MYFEGIMERQNYLDFVKIYENLRERAHEILRHARIIKQINQESTLEDVLFEADRVEIIYDFTCYGDKTTERILISPELLYLSDWKEEYNRLAEENAKRQAKLVEAEEKAREEREKQNRFTLYQKFKTEFEHEQT